METSVESLLGFQVDLSKRIFKARQNFKKSPKERVTKVYLETRLETLEQIWAEFRLGHKEMLQQTDPKLLKQTSYFTDDVYNNTEEEFTDYKCELKDVLETFLKGPNFSHLNLNDGQTSVKSTLVKLPKIVIPLFSGKYTEWTTFRDLFVSMIHSNNSLDNVQKLQYLKGYLTGEAEQLIRYIPVTEANYTQCWKTLEERYSNKKYLSHCILKRLLGQRSAATESAGFLKELMDTSADCLNALTNLGINVTSWDIIVIHLLSLKLDPESRKQWELNVTTNVASDALPTFSQFKEFLTSRYRALEFIEPKIVNKAVASYPRSTNNFSHTKVLHATNMPKMSCEFCQDEHKLCLCKKFANLDYDKRHEFVSNNRICFNCLGSNHGVRFCQNATSCRICKKRHHSLLHPKDDSTSSVSSGSSGQTVVEASDEVSGAENGSDEPLIASHMACCAKSKVSTQVLLATALIDAEARTGYQVIRALLDQGSQASFVTEAAVQRLGLKKIPIKNIISGLGGDKSSMISKYMVAVKIKSRTEPNFEMELNAYVLSNITTYLPGKKVALGSWVELNKLCLADPTYDVPNKIEVLLGAEVYCQILKEGLMRGPMGFPVAQNTTLGWILSGPVSSEIGQNKVTVLHAHVEADELIKRFWEIESEPVIKAKILSEDEQRCEDIFAATTCRSADGRYVVKLPFRDSEPICKNGESRDIAVKRLKHLERKFSRDTALKEKYTEVINEYLHLGHMMLVPKPDAKIDQAVYLPHHAVIREDKSTTKVRVVFDASCKNRDGVSLNETLMVGPTLQLELRHLIMNWRTYPVCLIGDIVKMYRMVKVTEDDADYQRIVWREDPEREIRDYKLLTVTFGTASAPYLAVRTLNQVALDHQAEFPIAAARVAKEFYMDDLMTGGQTTEEVWRLYSEMKKLLSKGGFLLQKWSSNDDELLKRIHTETKDIKVNESKDLDVKDNNIVKILGLTWNRQHDEFRYSVQLPHLSPPITKRKIISDISRLFDPLGWIAPCVIKAKAFIQQLWITGVGWDEEPPVKLLDDWLNYREELTELNNFCIPRWLSTKSDDLTVELHGFSDASKIAYAGVVYLRVVSASGNVYVCLVGAKTRVAPIKQVSIPRLELCGAVLVAKLLTEIAGVLDIPKSNIKAWTDSTVVLAWLNKHPSNWKTFVANRVSEILTTLDSSHWFHVSTKDNPADCASRGLQPAEIAHHNLWKFGPDFLGAKEITYNNLRYNDTVDEKAVNLHVKVGDTSILDKYSSLRRLIRVVATCRRFITRLDPRYSDQGSSQTGFGAWELDEALTVCIKLAQITEFAKEVVEVKEIGFIQTKSSTLVNLTPFLDCKGVLRVGGRISQSQQDENVKHPVILSHKSHFARLIVAEAHEKTLHGDIQLMLNYIRAAYYITRVKDLVKYCVSKCIRCIRHKAKLRTQLMGSLPSVRVTPARAFSRSGVDYAGPIGLRTSKGRGHHAYKGYICLFVCMVTRAVHIEVVSDLSSRGFLEAFKRFVARRGHCSELYSDNGTNFVGASKELKDLLINEESTMMRDVRESLSANGTTWHFIPARAPNFGGLWEAGIKSTKYHLKRVIGDATLTFEEMSTLLSQIEACLNSRPMSVVNNNPEEPQPLTPGHFLIGEPLVTIPESNYESVASVSSLKRWQLTQRMLQGFWRRWSAEYLTHCLHRYKWAFRTPEPQIGDVVLVKEDDLPPTKWLFGRIVHKYPGQDGLTRVVSLKCRNNIIKRPTSKLCILPVNE